MQTKSIFFPVFRFVGFFMSLLLCPPFMEISSAGPIVNWRVSEQAIILEDVTDLCRKLGGTLEDNFKCFAGAYNQLTTFMPPNISFGTSMKTACELLHGESFGNCSQHCAVVGYFQDALSPVDCEKIKGIYFAQGLCAVPTPSKENQKSCCSVM